MAEPFCECEHLTGKLQRLCRGEAETIAVCNKYRVHWGLAPLPNNAPAAKSDHGKFTARGGSVRIGAACGTQPATKPWDVSQPSRGLGDVIAKVTHATGIDRLVKAVTGAKGCGCGKRQAALNSAVPFGGSQ